MSKKAVLSFVKRSPLTVVVICVVIFFVVAVIFLMFKPSVISKPAKKVPAGYQSTKRVSLQIKSPNANQVISGKTPITVTFPQGTGISMVEFSVDGNVQETFNLNNFPYEFTFNFDVSKLTYGAHTFSVRAADEDGRDKRASVQVSVGSPAQQ